MSDKVAMTHPGALRALWDAYREGWADRRIADNRGGCIDDYWSRSATAALATSAPNREPTNEEIQWAQTDRFIAAVRSYWHRTGCLLEEAKEALLPYKAQRRKEG